MKNSIKTLLLGFVAISMLAGCDNTPSAPATSSSNSDITSQNSSSNE